MSHISNNEGIVTLGGTTQVTGSAVGRGATVYNSNRPEPEDVPVVASQHTYDIGIVTVLAAEAKAVIDVLELDEDATNSLPQRFHVGTVDSRGRAVRVVVAQALRPGQRPVMSTLASLHQGYDPAVNAFFTDHGDPAALRVTSASGATTAFRAVQGLIGSGEAVIADRASAIREFLASYNDTDPRACMPPTRSAA
jgi:adenosylhomocysteine nucleosidase